MYYPDWKIPENLDVKMKKPGIIIFVICIGVGIAGLLAFLFLTDEVGNISYDREQMIASGQSVYVDNCASCHGDKLQGEADWQSQKPDGTLPAPPHDDSGHTWHHDDQLLFDYTKKGGQAMIPGDFKSGMPAFEDILTDQKITAVLSFIKSQWSDRAQKYQKQLSAAKQ